MATTSSDTETRLFARSIPGRWDRLAGALTLALIFGYPVGGVPLLVALGVVVFAASELVVRVRARREQNPAYISWLGGEPRTPWWGLLLAAIGGALLGYVLH